MSRKGQGLTSHNITQEEIEAEKARLYKQLQQEKAAQDAKAEQARQEYAQQHRYDPVSGGDLGIMQRPGTGWTPQSTPQKPPSIQRTPVQGTPVQRRLIQGTPVMSAQRGYGQPAFGTPSNRASKTQEQNKEEDHIRALAAREKELRRDLSVLEAVQYDLHHQLQEVSEEVTAEQAEYNRKFFSGTGLLGPSPHKNTDKTYIKF